MKVSHEYSALFNSITETIEQLGKIIFTATSCLELLKQAQLDTEEMFVNAHEMKKELSPNEIN